MKGNRINCQKCIHYFVTWDPGFPYGCKLFGVKSAQTPSIVVYQSLGKMCDNYKDKTKYEGIQK